MDRLKFYSLNVNGLRDKYKRQTVLSYIQQKIHGIVLLQETHASPDLEQEWTELSNRHCYFSHGRTDSRGVAILIPKDPSIKVESVVRDEDGRFVMIDIDYDGLALKVANVYAPTKDKPTQQKVFYEKIGERLEEFFDEQIVLGGDFNQCLNPEVDKRGGRVEPESDVRLKLETLLEQMDLVDIWRIRYPNMRRYTWRGKGRGGLVQSRIDYFFISASLADVALEVDIEHGVCSDHSMLSLSIGNSAHKRGRGFWKFNSSLLKDSEFIELIKREVDRLKDELVEMDDKGLKWDLVKCKLRSTIISYSIHKSKTKKEYEGKLLKAISSKEIELADSGDPEVLEQLESLKQEHDSIQKERAQGAIIRSKAEWASEGEKNTSYFLKLEKHNAQVKHIKMLVTDKGIVECPKEVLGAEKEFYEKLYTEECDRQSSFENSPFLVDGIVTKVCENIAKKCDADITGEECHKALLDMENNKSPGSDGLSADFYKYFWENIKDLILDSFTHAFQSGKMSIEQRRGVISLIPKKDKDVRFLKNWRPISLLNTDYKILTKVLACRLQLALKEVISSDQTGYIKDRYIGENIRIIEDIVYHTTQNNAKGFIVLLDFEKAFDSVNINFLKKTLDIFSFGDNFKQWIGILYNQVSSCVINNGHTSEFFQVTRGIRQGCPISAMLFLLVVELLSAYIKQSQDIEGLTVGDETYVITQLADDTTLFVKNEKSIHCLMHVMQRFYESSGLRLNKLKCEIFILGNCGQGNNVPNNIAGMKCRVDSFKALGVQFSKDMNESAEHNFEQRFNKCKILVNIWSQRQLSLKGKIIVLKSLILPNLLYTSANLYASEAFIGKVQKLVSHFVWSGKPPKIKEKVMIADIEQGGLRMPHFPTMVESAKVMWIKRLLDPESKRWKQLAYESMSIDDFELLCKNDVVYRKPIAPFYQQVLRYWYNFHSVEPSNIEDIKAERLWYNKFIQVDNKPIFYKKWFKNGIESLSNILRNGKLATAAELMETHGFAFNTLDYLSLVQAIPKSWLRKVFADKPEGDASLKVAEKQSHVLTLPKLTSAKVYWKLLERIVKQPVAIEKWISLFPYLHDNDFNTIYKMISQISEVRMQSFQYRLLNRILPCGYQLNKWGVTSSPLCNVCDNVDTLEHFFYYCKTSKTFWQQIENWFKMILKVHIPLKITDIMFGIPYKKSQDVTLCVLNFIVIHGKWFMYCCKKESQTVSISKFLCYIKYRLKIEHQVSISKGTERTFQMTYDTLMNNI